MNVGQSMAALQVMHEAMVSKRYRVFTESHETLMMRFLELCVDLRKGKLAKEALHAFKNLTLTVAISSLEVILLMIVFTSTLHRNIRMLPKTFLNCQKQKLLQLKSKQSVYWKV